MRRHAVLIYKVTRYHAPLWQVQGHVEDAIAKGGRVTIGGKRPDLPEPYNKVRSSGGTVFFMSSFPAMRAVPQVQAGLHRVQIKLLGGTCTTLPLYAHIHRSLPHACLACTCSCMCGRPSTVQH